MYADANRDRLEGYGEGGRERESEKWGQMDQQNWTKGKERERTQEWKGGYVYIDNSIAMNRSMAIPMAYNIAIVESYYEQ